MNAISHLQTVMREPKQLAVRVDDSTRRQIASSRLEQFLPAKATPASPQDFIMSATERHGSATAWTPQAELPVHPYDGHHRDEQQEDKEGADDHPANYADHGFVVDVASDELAEAGQGLIRP